jgi:endonuclease/exonuclease/phosphatase (EEP) superfamily protein YafD
VETPGPAQALALFLALTAATVSLLSAIESRRWWIRIWDFPRMQILVLTLAAAALVVASDAPWRWPVLALLAVAAAWQFYRIFPYTPLARREVAFVKPGAVADDACFSALTFNVLQFNRAYARTIALLEAEDPDIVLLLETDADWADALAPFLARYPTIVACPQDNTYGLMFATRLACAQAELHYLVEPDTPSILATLATPAGTSFRLIGLHPRPPAPAQDTNERDAEIAIAAIHAARTPQPTLALGDFNDVAWSHTSQLFKRIGGYLDPRVGRGRYPTFPARWPMLRWPLDHVFISPEFVVRSMRVLRNVGSDHLPVLVHFGLVPHVAPVVNDAPEAADSGDWQDAHKAIADGNSGKVDD